MKRIWIFAATLVLLSQVVPAQAQTQTWFGFQVGVSGGSPPPAPMFRSEPRVIVVNDGQGVDDEQGSDDVFRTVNTWWRLRGGYWYRSSSWRGPWASVDLRRVPDRVLVLPARTWKHHPRQDGLHQTFVQPLAVEEVEHAVDRYAGINVGIGRLETGLESSM
mgnify:CR=1 FL=1